MNESQVRELIENLDYDKDAKARFLGKLKDLYKKHDSFLSIPLLCIIMLITFDQSGDIPDKKHTFFEHGFDALFFRHDASKQGAYKRKIYSEFTIDDFRNCLSAFCITTYTKEKFSFTLEEITDFLKKAFEFEGMDIGTVDSFLKDLLESVCVMQQEGVEYTFTHRSFQEYFAARFISRSPDIEYAHFLDQFCRRREDTVVEMAFDMNRPLLEREWILPKLKQICELSDRLDLDGDLIGYVTEFYGGIVVHARGPTRTQFYYVSDMNSLGHVAMTIKRLYPDKFLEIYATTARRFRKEKPMISARLNEMKKLGESRFGGKAARTGSIPLRSEDSEWLKETRIYPYLKAEREIMHQLLGQVSSAVIGKAKGRGLL